MGRKKLYENPTARKAAWRSRQPNKEKKIARSSTDKSRDSWRNRPIIAIDGEGEDHNGQHFYTLIAAGDGNTSMSKFASRGIKCKDCLDFLFATKAHYRGIYNKEPLLVIFAGSYDFTMMLKGLEPNDIRNLYDCGSTVVYLERTRYHIALRQRKMLQVTRYVSGIKESLTVYDVFGFFQSSFITALISWGIASDQELEPIAEMKDRRGDFASLSTQKIKEYNEKELYYLVRLVEKLRTALDECGFYISSWHGAGAIASYLMKQHKIKEHIIQTFQEPIQTAIKTAYFGGRVQLLKAGHFPTVYGHDLISAYPSAQTMLPSLIDCKIQHSNFFYDMPYSIHRVRWRLPHGTKIQPFPLRQSTSIYYENCGEGYYWYPEVKAALKHYGNAIEVLETYTFRCNSMRPFSYIAELFDLRKQYKAKKNPAEKPLKLGYNSHYGKHAQHTDRTDTKLPTFQCYWYAGYITSECRARVFDLAMRNAESVIAIATDGIFSTARLTETNDTGTNLGQWENAEYQNFFIVQPGVYTYEKDGIPFYKSRGLRPSEVDWNALKERFYDRAYLSVKDFVAVPVERFIGLNTAVARNRVELMGSWERGDRELHILQYPDRAVADDYLVNRKRFHIAAKSDGTYVTYYGRVRDNTNWRTIEPLVSEPFLGRYDPANLSEYVTELSEIADNPEIE